MTRNENQLDFFVYTSIYIYPHEFVNKEAYSIYSLTEKNILRPKPASKGCNWGTSITPPFFSTFYSAFLLKTIASLQGFV
ncbi:MAG: hypothetical protein D3917_09495 [Candidatus Electrothrix sp. AX5]|nr:hypothetical protein [Candidatus Electrothrix sp. AX5]